MDKDKSLGFVAKADLQEEDGIKYVPMEYLHLIDMLQDKAELREIIAQKQEE